ncbi:MAG: hypothetical protein ABR889_04650 [Acidobacteriaceae bacterium]|jgi:hypothetical protein
MVDISQNSDEKNTDKSSRLPRDMRYRIELFPDADRLVFNTSEKGFVPIPIILRKVLRFLSSPETRVLLYLHLRASRYSICYPPVDEIVHELGLTSKKNLLPHIEGLAAKRFISVRTSGNRTFYLIHDPRVAIMHLLESGQVKDEDLFEINDLYADLNQAQLRNTPKREEVAQ